MGGAALTPDPLPKGEGRNLHRNEDGVMSIFSVFAVLALTMLLGMVMNVGRQVDGKIRMQNAADAAAYSGALTLTRGMNTLACTNRLLCEVFSLTAILREGRDQNEKSYIPEILAAWKKAARQFAGSGFETFVNLGRAIDKKAPQEQTLADTYLAWIGAVSAIQLPIFESVLSQELIPKFQRNLLQYYPDVAQSAADEAAQFNGTPDYGRGTMHAASGEPRASRSPIPPCRSSIRPWTKAISAPRRTNAALGDQLSESMERGDDGFFRQLRRQNEPVRRPLRGFTCGQLEKLIAEYENSNLPMQIIEMPDTESDQKAYLDTYLTFVGVAYWSKPMARCRNCSRTPFPPTF